MCGKYAHRTKTNSMTHLVKIVAEEVLDEKIKNGEFAIVSKAALDALTHQDERIMEQGDAFRENMQSSMEKAGLPWSKEENTLLLDQFKTAIAQAAVNHGRSKGAIKARFWDFMKGGDVR